MKKFLIVFVVNLFILGTIASFSMNVSASQEITKSNSGFSDVSSSHIFYDEINYLSSALVISGYHDGMFKPDYKVTRAQAAIMIGKALKLEGEPRNTHFKDVTSSVTGSGYIASAVERGIISGYHDGTYRPYESVTRGQMAMFLNRAFTLTTGQVNYFRDVSSNMAAYQSILNVFEVGIASGYHDGTFRPSHPVSRGEFSAFMARVLEPSFRNVNQSELVVNMDQNLSLNGISLGLSKQEVIDLLGEPLFRDKDDMYDDYFLYKLKNTYDNTVSDVSFSFYNGRVVSVAFDINNHVFNADWYKNLGQPFANSDGVTYFYLEEKEQVLMFKPGENHAYIVYADNNFYYWFGMSEKMY